MSANLTTTNTLRTIPITDIKTETPTTKTYTVKDKLLTKAKPGQFLMLWIPGTDEIPISISNTANGTASFTVKAIGDATKKLHNMKPGDIIGVRGPLGNSFTESRGHVLLIGGGTGTAPLLFLAKKLAPKADRLSFIIGANTKGELLFRNELEAVCAEQNTISTTEDGSYGLQCLATEPLEKLLEKEKFHIVYTCGPERMVRKVFDTTEKHKTALEASLERLMRCGIGLCGSCVIGKYRVCRDGPVFTAAQLREVKEELGISKIGFDGARIPV